MSIAAPNNVAHRPVTPPTAVTPIPPKIMRTPRMATQVRTIGLSISDARDRVDGRSPSRSFDRWLARGSIRLDDDGRAVGDDLGHRPRELRAVEAHRDHGVPAHQAGVLDQPVEGLAPGVLEQRRVFVNLTAAERTEAGEEVAGEAPAADHEPERLALRLDDPMSGDEWGGGDDHRDSLMRAGGRSPSDRRSNGLQDPLRDARYRRGTGSGRAAG